MDPILYIIIPCYNEEEVLPITCEMFLEKLTSLIGKSKISDDSRILFVNDGSKDKTWDIICGLAERCISRAFPRAATGDIRMQCWQGLWTLSTSAI